MAPCLWSAGMVFLKSCLPLLKLRRLLELQFVVLQGTSPCKLAGQYSSGRKLHGPVLYCLRAHPWGSSTRTTLILVPHRLHPLLPLICKLHLFSFLSKSADPLLCGFQPCHFPVCSKRRKGFFIGIFSVV